MKTTQIGLNYKFPFSIRDGNVYSSTLVKNGKWDRSPLDEDVKAFSTFENAQKYINKKNFFGAIVIEHNDLY